MAFDSHFSRADLLRSALAGVLAGAIPASAMGQVSDALTIEDLRGFAKVAGLKFTDAELLQALKDLADDRIGYEGVRALTAANGLTPSTVFRVWNADEPRPAAIDVKASPTNPDRPKRDEDVAFMTVVELGALIRAKKLSSLELTKIYLDRLKVYGPKLLCLVTLTEELALKQAAQADAEIAGGNYRGPLHGIPYGLKDLFAVKGYPTQWGTAAFKDQTIDEDCAVFDKLTAAGAVCVAKLSLGALAMNDNWFGGRTKNPWNPKEGSSGSSAGSACATAAGLVAFAIGTETSGSIVSPSSRCRVTGFRPTFGSISRYGAMCLAWSMDKIGPICRTAEDAALVFAAILGRDPRDAASVARGFRYRPRRDLKGLTVGLIGKEDQPFAKMLAKLGAELKPFKIPASPPGLGAIIGVEGAAMFDEITRNGRLNLVTENGWPAIFRAGRFIPAVEYAQAERARTLLVRAYREAFEPFDMVAAPGTNGAMIYSGNLVGTPQIFSPFDVDAAGAFSGFSLLGKPFSEGDLAAAAFAVQRQTGFYLKRPDLSSL